MYNDCDNAVTAWSFCYLQRIVLVKKSSSIFIDADYSNVRVALLENNELAEFYIESSNTKKLVGNIYKGVVVNVLQGMQAAFVDIGLARNAFLYVGNTAIDRGELDRSDAVKIPDKLAIRQGDEIMVQVIKDEAGTKGARISDAVSLAGRFVVMTPTLDFIGVSRKITDEKVKERLYKLIETNRVDNCGFIVRTVAAEATKREIIAEMKSLYKLWITISQRYKSTAVRQPVYSEGDLVTRTLRDMLSSDVERIVVNSLDIYDDIRSHFNNGLAVFLDRLELYEGTDDLYKKYGIREKIDKLLDRKVWLSNGGYLIIDKTEALTVIDVNSGKYVGSAYLEQTVFEVNCQAAREIARQVRLRNIAGIIVIDFIDMEMQQNKQHVLKVLEESVASDRTKCKVLGMSALGLVEMTRKKIRNDISACLEDECPTCHGSGHILSLSSVINNIRTDLSELIAKHKPHTLIVGVNIEVFHKMFSGVMRRECENEWERVRIYIIADATFKRDDYQFRIENSRIITLPDSAKLLY